MNSLCVAVIMCYLFALSADASSAKTFLEKMLTAVGKHVDAALLCRTELARLKLRLDMVWQPHNSLRVFAMLAFPAHIFNRITCFVFLLLFYSCIVCVLFLRGYVFSPKTRKQNWMKFATRSTVALVWTPAYTRHYIARPSSTTR